MTRGGLTFGDAVEAIKSGHSVARRPWGPGTWVALVVPDDQDRINRPVIILDRPSPAQAYPGGQRGAYVPSHEDILARDWELVE